ncbi:reverse transcriptase domain, reverse transcriptase zinc-binding domain protein [Tanacetum coccineum]
MRRSSHNTDSNGWTWIFRKNKYQTSKPIGNPFQKDPEKVTSSFNVTNFPESINAKELWNTFVPYGRLADTFIPNKRSKGGKRFDFIRFLGVKDVHNFALSLSNVSNVLIGSFHLFVTVANYQRPNSTNPIFNLNKVNMEEGKPKPKTTTHAFTNILAGKPSFASVVHGPSSKDESPTSTKVGEDLGGLGIDFSSSFVGDVGNGCDIRFWIDRWVGGERLCDRFSRLYHLDRRKEVRLRIKENSVVTVDCKDCWMWSLHDSGEFTVKELSKLVEEKSLIARNGGRLPVREELDKRGIDLDSLLCPSCNSVVESCAHCLVLCNFAMSIWEKIHSWWKIRNVNAFSIEEMFSRNRNANIPSHSSKLWQAVIWTAGYYIWKVRNMRVFEGKVTSINSLVQDIQIKSFKWIVRSRKRKMRWNARFGLRIRQNVDFKAMCFHGVLLSCCVLLLQIAGVRCGVQKIVNRWKWNSIDMGYGKKGEITGDGRRVRMRPEQRLLKASAPLVYLTECVEFVLIKKELRGNIDNDFVQQAWSRGNGGSFGTPLVPTDEALWTA